MRIFYRRFVYLIIVVFLYSLKMVYNSLKISHKDQDLKIDEEIRQMYAAPPTVSKKYGSHQEGATNYTYYRGKNIPDDILGMRRPSFLSNYKNPCWYDEQDGGKKYLRCLPYFRLIGVDKCGTTDLWYRMAQHTNIVRPKAVMGKETHWLSWRRFGFDIWVKNKAILHYDWYLSHFDAPARKIEQGVTIENGSSYHPLITGEGSPTEFWDFTGWNLIPQNDGRTAENAFLTPHCLKHLTPEVKLIVLLRNPTERLYSDYLFLDQFRFVHNVSVEGFHQDVINSIQMLQDCIKAHSQLHCLYNKELHMKMPVRLIVGLYDIFLSQWLKVFPSEHVMVLRNEDYSKNIKLHLAAVFSFLKLPPLEAKQMDRIVNLPRVFVKSARSKSLGPMHYKTKRLLDAFYHPFNEMLAQRFNNSNYLWDH